MALIQLDNLKQTAFDLDTLLREYPALLLEPMLQGLRFNLTASAEATTQMHLERKGGLLRPYTGQANATTEDAFRLTSSTLTPELGYVALVDNLQNYRNSDMLYRAGKAINPQPNEAHPLEREILQGQIKTLVEDFILGIPHGKKSTTASPLSVFDGFYTQADTLTTEGEISEVRGNLVTMEPLDGNAASSAKNLKTVVEWLRALSPALKSGPVVLLITPSALLKVLDAFEYQRKYTGERTITALQDYLQSATLIPSITLASHPALGGGGTASLPCARAVLP